MITDIGRHLFWSMANNVYHAPPFFFMALQTEIISTKISDFLKQIIILKSFNSVLRVFFVSKENFID